VSEAGSARRVGEYTIRSELGAGGQGAIFAAEGPAGRPVALKLLHEARGTSVERFRQEARVLERLAHPNLPRVHGYGVDGVPYLACELVDGEDLARRVRTEGVPPVDWSVEVVARVAGALEYCHGRGVVHRDVKPNNVVVGRATGRPVLVDFGLAKRDAEVLHLSSLDDQGAPALSLSGALKGTPEFMAPEQANPQRYGAVGPATDVYGLGALLFYLLTGRAPFEGGAVVLVVRAVTRKAPPDPCALAPGVPRAVADVCLRALAKRPEDRPPSAAAFGRALAEAAGRDDLVGVSTTEDDDEGRRVGAAGAPPSVVAGLVVVAGVAAAVAVGLAGSRGEGAPGPTPSAPGDAATAAASPGSPWPAAPAGWETVWRLGDAEPLAAEPDACWPEPGRVVDPLGPLQEAPLEAPVPGFLGEARALGDEGRIRVAYDLERALRLDHVAPGDVFLLGGTPRRVGPGAVPGERVVVAENDTGTHRLALGRARWARPRLETRWRLVAPDDREAVSWRFGRGAPEPVAVGLVHRNGTLAAEGARAPLRVDYGAWHELVLEPGGPVGGRVRLDGATVDPLDAALVADPPGGGLGLVVSEARLGVAGVVVSGRPRTLDVPALARAVAFAHRPARVAAAFAPARDGPLVVLGADPATAPRLALEDGRLVLARGDRLLAAAELTDPPGWLVLERAGARLQGEAGGSGPNVTLEALDPLPSPDPEPSAGYGSRGRRVVFEAAAVFLGPPDPARAAFDGGAARGGPAGAIAAARGVDDPRAAWWIGALELARASDLAWADPALVGPAARGRRRAVAASAAGLLEEAAGALDGARRVDALARAVLARVVAVEPESAEAAARRLIAAAPAEGRARLDALERGPDGAPALVGRLVRGYVSIRDPLAQEAALRAAAVVAPERRGEVLMGRANVVRRRPPRLDAASPEGRARLEEALALLDAAKAAGADPQAAGLHRADTLLELGRPAEALIAYRRAGGEGWWAARGRALAHARLGQAADAFEAVLEALAAADHHPLVRGVARSLASERRLANAAPGRAAVVLAHLVRLAGRPQDRDLAVELAGMAAVEPGPRGDLGLYALDLLAAHAPPPPDEGDAPGRLVRRARRGDAGARAALAERADDAFLQALVRLDPELGSPR